MNRKSLNDWNRRAFSSIDFRPGFTRLNLSFFATDDEIDYVLNAVQFVASEGWKFLPLVSLRNRNQILSNIVDQFSTPIIPSRLPGHIVVVFN